MEERTLVSDSSSITERSKISEKSELLCESDFSVQGTARMESEAVYPKKMACQKLRAKKICTNIKQLAPLKITKPVECHSSSKKRSCMKVYREAFCPKPDSLGECISISAATKTPTIKIPSINFSGDSYYYSQTATPTSKRALSPARCIPSDFGDNYVPYVGKCTKEQKDRVPPKKHNWAPQFYLTEDPRKTQCLRNPKKNVKPKKPEKRWKEITEKIKLAENVDTSSSSAKSDVACVEIDVDNPAGADFQMWDYRQTYLFDEQNIEDGKEYLKQKRYFERKDIRSKMPEIYEDIQYKKKVNLPKVFDVDVDYDQFGLEYHVDREETNLPKDEDNAEVVDKQQPKKLAELLRTRDKILNKSIIEMENEVRFGRYYNLYEKKAERRNQQKALEDAENKEREENMAFIVADEDFNIERNEEGNVEIQAKYDALHKTEKRKWYPHTIAEVKKLRQTLKRSKNVLRDQALIKREFFYSQGLNSKIKEVDLEISSKSETISSHSERSTDDEDTFEVGYKESQSKFYLRGQLFKLGTEPRGKLHSTQKGAGRAVRTCQTRSEWFENLVPKSNKESFMENKLSSVVKPPAPDDPKLRLFAPGLPEPITYDHSSIKEFINQPMGLLYQKGRQKRLRIKKPKTIKVKKFNLTGFVFGAVKEDAKRISDASSLSEQGFGPLAEYLQKKKRDDKQRIRKKRQRMRYLGIPTKNRSQKKSTTDQCENLESEDSDWIPDPEPPVNTDEFMKNMSNIKLYSSGHGKIILGPPISFDYWPAPKFREPTLKRHPRKPRNISEISNRPEVPCLECPPDDKIVPYNLKMPKTEYARRFEARHHHDHFNPTQHKYLKVRYKSVVPKLDVMEESVKVQKKEKRPFEKAQPQGPNPGKFIDRSIPQLSPVQLNKKDLLVLQKPNLKCGGTKKKSTKISNRTSVSYSSNRQPEPGFPGHKEFLELIKETTKEVKKRLAKVEEEQKTYVIDKDAYVKELEEDLVSIKSCVSTLDSSQCTNFTNDSGSFVMIQDTKLPLDFIKKSLVPFEEINRVRLKVAPIDPNKDENLYPYAVVPYAGQRGEQRQIYRGDVDKFYTFNSRVRNDLRRRLEVEPENIDKSLIGNERTKKQGGGMEETDSKELEQILIEPPFKPKSTLLLMKDALRQKFEVWHIQSQFVQQTQAEKKEDQYAAEVVKLEALYDRLFNRWQKLEYDRSMAKIRVVKMYYEAVHFLKKQLAEVEKKLTKLNMRIVFTESDWVRRTILQNFHYLIMKNSWREKNDWIHKKEDGTLENYRESIEKRKYVNIRQRDRDDAWAIKYFYENHYLKNKHTMVIVHPNVQSFLRDVIKLKTRTFVCLLELHYTLWILTNLQHTHRSYLKWSEDFIQTRSKFVKGKCAKKYFMEDRVEKLKRIALDLLEKPLTKSISRPMLRWMRWHGDLIHSYIFPGAGREQGIAEKIGQISDYLVELFGKFEPYDSEKVKKAEKDYRRNLANRKRYALDAYKIERRIHLTINKIKANMAPPYKKPKRTGKLPRGVLKQKPTIVTKTETRLSARTLFFHKAFIPDGEEVSITSAELEKVTMENIEDTCIPFHFDYFLELNNYKPNYSFKTQVELTYGPEEKPFIYKNLLPIVYQKLDNWEVVKKKQQEDDIAKTMHLYENLKA